jgi:dipeptidyl aminopeptidase/acylaminoacyl peptidase
MGALLAPLVSIGEDLPVDYFFGQPSFREADLSPNGRYLAIRYEIEGVMNLGVIDLKTNKPTPITAQKEDISWFHWVNNERIVYGMDSQTDVFARRLGGIFSVNRDGSKHRTLVMPLGAGADRQVYTKQPPRYLGPDPESEERILLAQAEGASRYPDIISMDAYTGSDKGYLTNTVNARFFATDVNDEVRFAFQTEFVGKTTVFIRDEESGDWEEMTTLPETDADWRPLDYSPDRNTFLVSTNLERNRNAIVRFNRKTGEMEEVYSDPVYDVNPQTIFEIRKKDEVVGFYYQADKLRSHFFDPQHKKLQQLIDQALPDTFNRIIDTDEKGTIALIQASSDRQLAEYFLLKLNNLQLERLESIAPWIKKENHNPKKPISFTASNGTTLHGYLVLPDQYEEGNPVPLILHPHGGPWARDVGHLRWYGDMEPHFYADRGFAVLQVNFRGSTGYGSAFLTESEHNIERMYLDTVEAADWAIEEGYAHPDRIAIAGASWGGYKTMLCAVKRPEFFKFGVNLFGVVDLIEHMRTYLQWDREEAYDYWVKRFGDPKEDEGEAYLREWSPLAHIDRLRAPVFIYHGLRDLNVDIEQSRILVNALEKRNHPYTKYFDTDEMHSMENEDTRLELYKKIDAFILPFRKKWGMVD